MCQVVSFTTVGFTCCLSRSVSDVVIGFPIEVVQVIDNWTHICSRLSSMIIVGIPTEVVQVVAFRMHTCRFLARAIQATQTA